MTRAVAALAALAVAGLVVAPPVEAAAPNYILVSCPGLKRPALLSNWSENHALLIALVDAPKAKARIVRGLARRPRCDVAEFWVGEIGRRRRDQVKPTGTAGSIRRAASSQRSSSSWSTGPTFHASRPPGRSGFLLGTAWQPAFAVETVRPRRPKRVSLPVRPLRGQLVERSTRRRITRRSQVQILPTARKSAETGAGMPGSG
jgi:hypothetical protein